jgi:predicted short-subunit dehydrogenase-like oxidoreductase (DUF2520 family)
MKIALIGSGNVATVLGRLIRQNGHQITQVISREIAHAKLLADELGCSYADFEGRVEKDADMFIVAIADKGLDHLFSGFGMDDKLVVHTAGSVAMNVLNKLSSNYGVLYPLQSLRKEMKIIPPVPFLVDGNSEDVTLFIEDFAKSLSSSVKRTNDEDRLRLHASAVIVSNFTNHLYAIAEEFCNAEKVDFALLRPLILETAYRVQYASPSAVQTGPAVRKDILTMDKHLRLLTAYPRLRTMYLRMTDSIMNP